MAPKEFRPEYSQLWLGRPFVLGHDSITWGRYVVIDSTLAAVTNEQRNHLAAIIRQADAGQLAFAFEHLIHVYCPGSLPDFLREIQGLATYHYAKEHRSALLRDGCTPDDYYRANIAVVSAFDDALSVVFQSSIPLHGLGILKYYRYRQKLHGMHLVAFTDDEHTYDVAFTRELVLESIRLNSDWSLIWPKPT
jgi:hypothetical protein